MNSTTVSTSRDFSKRSWIKRRPLLRNALFTDLQNGSYVAAIYTLVQSVVTQIMSIFDLYVLIEASPGSTHYRYFGINFLFVYSGNKHVRNALIFCSVVSFALAVYMLVVSIILMRALRKELEKKFKPWLIAATIVTAWCFVSIIFKSIANDMYYAYHQAMLIIWTLMLVFNVFFILVVYSNYQELADVTRLEDMARLKDLSVDDSVLKDGKKTHDDEFRETNPNESYGSNDLDSESPPSYKTNLEITLLSCDPLLEKAIEEQYENRSHSEKDLSGPAPLHIKKWEP